MVSHKFNLPCELHEITVTGDAHITSTMKIFRAPTVDSGSEKQYPHEIDWEHVQEGDSLIVFDVHVRDSGLGTLDILQFWDVIRRVDDDSFLVRIFNVVGLGNWGTFIVENINRLLDKKDIWDG
jgi:hypothetical protein